MDGDTVLIISTNQIFLGSASRPLVSSEQYFKITWLHVTTVYRQLCLSVLLTSAYLKNLGFFLLLRKNQRCN